MALKDILVYLDNSPTCSSRLDLAVNLARLHGACLTGIYIISHAYYAPRQGAGQVEAAQIEGVFREKTGEAGVEARWVCADWGVVGVSLTEILTLHAYYVDLVIVGQPNLSDPNNLMSPEFPERVAFGAGRPVMVIPYAGTYPTAGERVMVAWKAGRESTRALNDSLPLLKKASHVTVVSAAPGGTPDTGDERVELDICTHLSRHGIASVRETLGAASAFPIGDLLLNHACDNKIDLLVMGTFGQNRRGEFVLGPVARHLLSHLTVPLLISH